MQVPLIQTRCEPPSAGIAPAELDVSEGILRYLDDGSAVGVTVLHRLLLRLRPVAPQCVPASGAGVGCIEKTPEDTWACPGIVVNNAA